MRREFLLPEADLEYLEARGLPWESIKDGGSQWLLVHEFVVPSGYDRDLVTAALLIAPQYPGAKIDMVYFSPALSRADGKAIPALTMQAIGGSSFQRWSRHYNGDTWRLGVDDVGTHLLKVEEWLRREFRVRP